MLAVAVDFLMEKYFSARFEDGDSKERAEWPPHPVRLFRSLTSATFDSPLQQDPSAFRAVLEWLERQEAPEVYAAPLPESSREVGVFVPVNDKPDGQRACELLAMRARKERRFPAAAPETTMVYFVWPQSEPTKEHLAALNEMMRFVPYLGSSRSFTSMWLTDTIKGDLERWRPAERGSVLLRIAPGGSLRDLEHRAQQFRDTGQKAHRPSAGLWTAYQTDRTDRAAKPPQGAFGEILVFEIRDAMFTLEATLALCAKWKEALIGIACRIHGDAAAPPYLTGHLPGVPTEPARRSHVCAVPLAHVGAQYADGRVQGLGALIPSDLDVEERRRCFRAIQEIDHLNLEDGQLVGVGPPGLDESRVALSVSTWTRPSLAWESVTPFVFHRFPKRPGDAARLIEQAVEFAGLPKPSVVLSQSVSQLRGVPFSGRFKARTAARRPQRFHQHAYVEFSEPIAGPLLLGAGQSYGYGFFRPVRARHSAGSWK